MRKKDIIQSLESWADSDKHPSWTCVPPSLPAEAEINSSFDTGPGQPRPCWERDLLSDPLLCFGGLEGVGRELSLVFLGPQWPSKYSL